MLVKQGFSAFLIVIDFLIIFAFRKKTIISAIIYSFDFWHEKINLTFIEHIIGAPAVAVVARCRVTVSGFLRFPPAPLPQRRPVAARWQVGLLARIHLFLSGFSDLERSHHLVDLEQHTAWLRRSFCPQRRLHGYRIRLLARLPQTTATHHHRTDSIHRLLDVVGIPAPQLGPDLAVAQLR